MVSDIIYICDTGAKRTVRQPSPIFEDEISSLGSHASSNPTRVIRRLLS
jgi:hypothetical protein